MFIIYLHAKNLGFFSEIELGNIIITFAHFSFSRNFDFVKFISPICFVSQLVAFLYGLIYPLTRFMPKIMKFCRKLRGTGVMAFFISNWAGIINITFRHFGFSIFFFLQKFISYYCFYVSLNMPIQWAITFPLPTCLTKKF